jgi:phosphoenolpyruvate synthase/pyruvate phosphate dikinase
LFSSRPNLVATVSRRRTERHRLAKVDLPLRFTQPIDLFESSRPAEPERVIIGMPAGAGVAVGRVRVLRSLDDELEPGEVVVARVTDTGWTPFFATVW